MEIKRLYNLSATDGRAKWATAEDITAAAVGGMDVMMRGVRGCVAAVIDGYVTMVAEGGAILQGWAGECTLV